MKASARLLACALLAPLALVACNSSPPKQAENASEESSSSESSSASSSGGSASSEEKQEENMARKSPDEGSGSSAGGSGGDSSSGEKVPYDKEMTEKALNRASRQIKANCGRATEEDGKSVGPWGNAKLSIRLGHNGHVKDVKVPEPFDGKAVGRCAAQAFDHVTFPPWQGSDVTIDWDVEIVDPKSGKK